MASDLSMHIFRATEKEMKQLRKKADELHLSLNNLLRYSVGLPPLDHGGPRVMPRTLERKRKRVVASR